MLRGQTRVKLIARKANLNMANQREPDCLYLANDIVRRVEPKEWRAALDGVPDRCKAEVETYLRGIAKRIRLIRELKQKAELESKRDKARSARRR